MTETKAVTKTSSTLHIFKKRLSVKQRYGLWTVADTFRSCQAMHREWLLEEAARTAARRDWRRMGCSSESVAYSRIVASYRRRMGVVAVREMARHRIRQSAYVGLTRQQLDDIMQERERQRDRLEAAAAAADRSVEIAQSYVVPAFERGA